MANQRRDKSHPQDFRKVFTERPHNFHELVDLEMRLLRERGYIQFVDDHGRSQRIYLSAAKQKADEAADKS